MSTDDSATPPADSRGQDPSVHEVDPPAALPAGPPWPVEVIADLHAGRYPADVAGPLRQRIAADPWAASVLTSLDATVDDLSLLPVPRMPERFVLRLDAAIAAEYRAAAAARGVPGGADAAGSQQPIDRSVPLPRKAVDQSLSPLRGRGEQFSGQSGAGQQLGAGQQWGVQDSSGPSELQRRSPRPVGPPGPPVPLPGPPTDPAPGVGPAGAAAAHPSAAQPPVADRSAGGPAAFTALPPGVRSLDAARAKRRRWIGGLAAAAAVVAIGTASVVSLQHPASTAGPTATAPAPAPGTGANALELDPGRFADALQQIEGKRPVGPLQDAATYSSCLAANSIDPSAVMGVTSATFQGKPATAIAVRIDATSTKVVVVGPHCGIQGAADQLASETVTN